MDRLVRRAYLDMISKRVWPALKAVGFKRSSGTFRLRSGDDDAVVVEFQGSASSGGDLSLSSQAPVRSVCGRYALFSAGVTDALATMVAGRGMA